MYASHLPRLVRATTPPAAAAAAAAAAALAHAPGHRAALRMDTTLGWLVGVGHPDTSLTRLS
jgi:hypothetical protein